jgi:phage gp46-like protein
MAILVTWNPHTNNPDYSWTMHMAEASKLTLAGELYREGWWNVRTKDAKVGGRLFLLRQSVEPKGSVGSG